MKKLVEREHLQYVSSELYYIKLKAPAELSDRIEALLKYIDDHVLQPDQDSRNEFKRVIYRRMKEAGTAEESRQWYDFYKSLDDTF